MKREREPAPDANRQRRCRLNKTSEEDEKFRNEMEPSASEADIVKLRVKKVLCKTFRFGLEEGDLHAKKLRDQAPP